MRTSTCTLFLMARFVAIMPVADNMTWRVVWCDLTRYVDLKGPFMMRLDMIV